MTQDISLQDTINKFLNSLKISTSLIHSDIILQGKTTCITLQHVIGYVRWFRLVAPGIFLPLHIGGASPLVGPMFGEEHLLAASFATFSPATETPGGEH